MEVNKPFFSVIMPVYNAVPFLQRAIESILEQTYTNFELILVDDQSTDNSYDICESYLKKDNRIKLYQMQQNAGAAAARNYGLSNIKGKYVTFCDSDDYVDKDLLATAYIHLRECDIDCLKYGCIEEYIQKDTKNHFFKVQSLLTHEYRDRNEIAKQILKMELVTLFGYLWNGFYRREIIEGNGLELNPSYRVNEDFDFNIRYFEYVNIFKCIDYTGYHYIKLTESNSLSSQKNDDYYNLHIMKIERFLAFFHGFENMDDESKSMLFWMYTRIVYSTLQRAIESDENIQKLLTSIRDSKIYNYFKCVEFINISEKQKLMIFLLRDEKGVMLLWLVRMIGLIKRQFPFLFAKIKG